MIARGRTARAVRIFRDCAAFSTIDFVVTVALKNYENRRLKYEGGCPNAYEYARDWGEALLIGNQFFAHPHRRIS